MFGKIVVGVDDVRVENFQSRQEMILNNAGKIADRCWLEIPEHFPDAVLHEYIVMPNHVHGIIELKWDDSVRTSHVMSVPDNSDIPVGTSHVMSQRNHNQFSKPIPGSISVIIQQYKSSVTRFVNKNNISHFRWQRNYYEHIIRNKQSYEKIADYIINNPKNWKEDNFFNE